MKTNTHTLRITTLALALSMTIASPLFALTATTDVNATVDTPAVKVDAKAAAKLAARIETGQKHADQEVDRRVTALNDLIARVATIDRLTDAEKTSITGSIQSQITALNSLKAKIDADTDIDTLKTDIKTITQAYRIFMLVIPQGRIVAVSDTIFTTSDILSTLGTKLSARITAAGTAGKNVTALTTLLADLNAKAADAKVQAQAAVTLVAGLSPDNGDTTAMKANDKAFADARAKIKLARADLKTSRDDAHKIIEALKGMKLEATATSTTSVQQ